MSYANPTLSQEKIQKLMFESGVIGTGEVSAYIRDSYKKLHKHYYSPVSRQSEEERFLILKTKWEAETAFLASITGISMHPAYQQIIGMGPTAIPLILSDLGKKPGHWFWALKSITGEDPVLPEHRGNMKQMAEDWLRWGKENGYLKEYDY